MPPPRCATSLVASLLLSAACLPFGTPAPSRTAAPARAPSPGPAGETIVENVHEMPSTFLPILSPEMSPSGSPP